MNSQSEKLERLSEKQRRLLTSWLLNFDRTDQGNDSLAESRKHLVAYCIPKQKDCTLNTDDLRDYLKVRLPEYMIPDQFVTLESMPRLPNGKINTRGLPTALRKPGKSASETVGPRNEIEHILASIWSELLRVDHPGVQDNFFEFGGDSILIIQLISRSREAGLNIEPHQVAKHPTLAGLASVVSKKSGVTRTAPERSTGEAAGTPIQQWFLNRNLKAPHHWNQSRIFSVDSSLDAQILERAVCACMDHHDALRARFARVDGIWKQQIPINS